jgi:ferritin-like metal-binding protein YciE
MATISSSELIKRYLQDIIASEKAFESQLRSMSEDSDNRPVAELFSAHADETKRQCNRLISRLQELGGNPSTAKSFIAHVFNAVPRAGQIGQRDEDRCTQNLIVAYAIEQSEVATYEALKVAAQTVGDTATGQIAEEIQQEERMAAQRIWNLLPANARLAVERQTTGAWSRSRPSSESGVAGSPI